MNAALSAGAGDTAPEAVLLSRKDSPSSCHSWQKTLWPSRLRRRPAKPMGSPRVGSNPTGVVRVQSGFVWKANTLQIWGRDDLDVFFSKNNSLNLLKKKSV